MKTAMLNRRRTMNIPPNDDIGIDLSKFDVEGNLFQKQNSANCYVVRSNGTYKFPLIYGNGIVDGEINSSAFSGNMYVNHLGDKITTPYIEDMSGCIPDYASLIWSDVDSITNIQVKLNHNRRMVYFDVENFPTLGGNAIIGIFDTVGNCIGSWHIWMYSDNLAPVTVVNRSGINYEILPVNLGWVWDSSNKKYGVSPYYQWGRKDPMLYSKSHTSGTLRTTYGTKTPGLHTTDDTKTVANAIANPWLLFTRVSDSNDHWLKSHAVYGLWASNKTIYDPCPAGWMVTNGFDTGFATKSDYNIDTSTFNVVGSFDSGWHFKKNPNDDIGVYFPALGCRSDYLNRINDLGSWGRYSYNTYNNNRRLDLDFNAETMWINSNAKGFDESCTIRPARLKTN